MTALTFAALRAANLARNSQANWMALDAWNLDDWMTAVAGEIGEACNVVKKLNRDRDGLVGNKRTRAELIDDLGDELADAAIYLDLMMARISLPIGLRVLSFQSLRVATIKHGRGWSMSRLAVDLVQRLGKLAIGMNDDYRRLTYDNGTELLAAIDALAAHAGIDLEAKVVDKFNRTSIAHGFDVLVPVGEPS